MAKNTHAQETATGTSDSYTEQEATDPHPPIRVTRTVLGGDPLSAGDNSLQFTKRQSTSESNTEQSHPQHAPTTDSPSSPQESGTDSDARMTDGVGQRTTRKQSARRRATKSADPEPESVPATDDDDFFE